MKELRKIDYFKQGAVDGIPIALGYIAVSFSLGIQAKAAGLNWFWATLMSLLNSTSAGQFAALTIISTCGSYADLALSQLIINLRYMLMSSALSQKIDPKAGLLHRLIMAGGITDEIFGISAAVKGKLSPFYTYGAMSLAIPGWALGTCLGVILGNILPDIIVTALSVAIYGMFIAIIIPPAKKDRAVSIAIIIAMISSYMCTILPVIKDIPSGTKIVILTVVISLIFAIVCPIDPDKTDSETTKNNEKEDMENA